MEEREKERDKRKSRLKITVNGPFMKVITGALPLVGVHTLGASL